MIIFYFNFLHFMVVFRFYDQTSAKKEFYMNISLKKE
jgi:hypothetical protein